MIYGHLEREHPRTTEAAQVHFKGGKVLITQPLGCLPFARPDNCKKKLHSHIFSRQASSSHNQISLGICF